MRGSTWRRLGRSRWSLLVILLAAVRAAEAGPLDPSGFPLSGTGDFPTLAGAYTISTDGTPTISGPGGISILGQVYSDAPGHSLAVFDFTSITITSAQSFSATGGLPLVLLSRGDATISGILDASGYGSVGGPGGGGGTIPGPGGGGYIFENGSGGGFGGDGGSSGQYTPFNPNIRPVPSLPGGKAYGDLTVSLQGGSAGGPGIGAGGGVEIGAVGRLTVNTNAQILANGASQLFFSGGGSGGGIFLHGDSVNVAWGSHIQANGGDGGRGLSNGGPGGGTGGGGGGGGGGRILFEYGSSLTFAGADLEGYGGLTHAFGTGSSNGGNGLFTYGHYGGPYTTTIFPEPSSFVLAAIAACALTGVRWLAHRRDRSRNS